MSAGLSPVDAYKGENMGWPITIRKLLGGLAVAALALTASAQEARPLIKGQTLYLPIYSHMLYGNLGKSGKASYVLLSALVSVRNTDAKRPLRVLSARYFDTNGKLLAERVPTPMLIPPLGTLELFVELNDASGGSGANFIIKWDAEQPINPPLVESLHANMDGGKAVIFTTQSIPLAE
ncbi:DUF3124 domain-containing protein [Dechloromonas sp. XY25]|uniref:DUF3124 domain-containing protein n=1 Tax=Dechloromonas hankyongensis TaxID=2908002 RepID=A0ABS9K0H3_9RHOO|nr:DUF3124 domain-containing protein [Dechloromonas hankyongensis]MCG2576655.1 DUF3124 domain-containing protein [Dechloromonas hankyongensis]